MGNDYSYKKNHKQKMQCARRFVAPLSAGLLLCINMHKIKFHLILQVIQMSKPSHEAKIFEIPVKLMTQSMHICNLT